MQENSSEVQNENIGDKNKPENEQSIINNSNSNIENGEIKNNNNLDNSSPQINPKEEEENKIKNENEIIINEDNNNIIKNHYIKNNNIKNNNIKNNNNIQNKNVIDNNIINNNNDIDIGNNIFPLRKKQFNFNNLSREEKMEQIENFLHSILSEASSIKEKGNEFYKNNNFEEAEKQYRKGINKINETSLMPDIEELNGQINNYLISITNLTIQLHNNLSAAMIKQEKYEETIKNCEFILQNLNQEHVHSYCRILFCLIQLKKVIMANHYAEIIKVKFGKQTCFSKFEDQLAKLEILNREFSDKILNENPELKKEVISMNDNNKIKNEVKIEEDNKNALTNYIPYIIGGAVILFAGASLLYKKLKK